MVRCAGGGIIRSSEAPRCQLSLLRQAGSLTVPARESAPHGSWESAMNRASSRECHRRRKPELFSLSRIRNPSWGGRIGAPAALYPSFRSSAALCRYPPRSTWRSAMPSDSGFVLCAEFAFEDLAGGIHRQAVAELH